MSRSFHSPASRRAFLQQASALGALVGGSAAPLALNLAALGAASTASAQTAADYRAVVCLFFYGGNDAFNTVLATDTASWNAYTTTRTQAPDPIALLAAGTAPNAGAAAGSPARLGGVLPIAPLNAQGRSFALHPLLAGLVPLFNTERRLAIVANVGPLLRPTSKLQYGQDSHPKPARLFSHNDQQNTWQALAPEGASRGWAGLMGDLLVSQNSYPIFTAVSASGNAVWLSGNQVQQYGVSSSGAIRLGVNEQGRVFGSLDVGTALHQIVTSSRSAHPFDADVAAVARRSIDAEALLRTALRPASDAAFGTPPAGGGTYNANTDPKLMYLNPLTGVMAANQLAQQFQVVARMVDAGLRGATGARRQVFFVSLGGFDTHDNQNRQQADLLARVAQALTYFDTTLGGLSARGQVTTFTASDFGRTFTSNGDGTDHGWGAHQFVMGGAVRGGDLYGRFPVLATKNPNNNNFDGSNDQLGNGSLLPALAVDQLGYTLGRWLGLGPTQLAGPAAGAVFPNLAQFDSSTHDLGFLTA
jgi:uncharacterized protein (DUF1501 family)